MVELRGLDVKAGTRTLLDGASASLRARSLNALIGRNGAGKSTLLKTITGLRPLYGGQVLINGGEIRELSPRQLAMTVAFVSTERIRIPSLSCRDIVAMGRAPYTNWIGRMQPADREIVDAALEAVDMQDYASRSLSTMSDGECQRIMIARAIAQDTPIILLDEPTSFLDMPGRYALAALLRRLTADSGKTILFSTHELEIAAGSTDHTWVIDGSRIIDIPSAELIPSGLLAEIFGINPLLTHQ